MLVHFAVAHFHTKIAKSKAVSGNDDGDSACIISRILSKPASAHRPTHPQHGSDCPSELFFRLRAAVCQQHPQPPLYEVQHLQHHSIA
jgi:hypothetical protein